ncbi:MAG: DUF3298 and DUF4163 domain-containing protein [Clostridiales bacterium]|nr:DUF3298 and DUF4163 domain-containing protein [Clostridiales bacterium]
MENLSATINKQEYKREFIYDDVVVLNTAFESIVVDIRQYKIAENRINATIERQLFQFLKDSEYNLFIEAVTVYKEAVANGYPIRPFESLLDYNVTYNDNGLLSLYRDRYDYTGGAHGITIRKSDTYNLKTGAKVPLDAFFPNQYNYMQYLIDEMIKIAKQDPSIYFENYQELIIKYFNPKSYYLTPNGIAIYYQQYEIAPYSTGIVVFEIPYKLK